MPSTVVLLGFAIFAQGTSELMLAGLLPDVAADLSVTVPDAGLLISGFALGMLVGAPILAIATRRRRRRRTLLAFLAVFAAAHVLGALTGSFAVLLASRVVGAFVYAGFWAVAAGTAVSLVPAGRRGRAMAILAGGLTVATVIGLPGGTWLGQHVGWRGAFWAVAGLTVLAAVGVLATVPAGRPELPAPWRAELRALFTPRLLLSYAMTAAATTGLLGTFSYLGALLIDTTGLAPRWVPLVLLGYGLGAVLGIAVGGRVADARPLRTLGAGFGGLLVVSVLIALAADQLAAVAVLAILLGLVGFGTNPALNSRVFGIAPAAGTLAAAGSVVAFNVGISLGPWLGGTAVTAGLGYRSVGWIGAGFAGLALVLLAVEARAGRRVPPWPRSVPPMRPPPEGRSLRWRARPDGAS